MLEGRKRGGAEWERGQRKRLRAETRDDQEYGAAAPIQGEEQVENGAAGFLVGGTQFCTRGEQTSCPPPCYATNCPYLLCPVPRSCPNACWQHGLTHLASPRLTECLTLYYFYEDILWLDEVESRGSNIICTSSNQRRPWIHKIKNTQTSLITISLWTM